MAQVQGVAPCLEPKLMSMRAQWTVTGRNCGSIWEVPNPSSFLEQYLVGLDRTLYVLRRLVDFITTNPVDDGDWLIKLDSHRPGFFSWTFGALCKYLNCSSVSHLLDMGSLFSDVIRETYKKNIYNEFKISLHPIFMFKHLQEVIIPSAWLRFFRDGLAQTGDEIVFRDVGEDKCRIELKKACRGFWVHAENISLLTAQESESDDISVNSGEALGGALLDRNTSAVSRNTSVVSISSREIPLWEWISVVASLIVELLSAVFEQLSSPHKPLYALMAMAFSLLALAICVIELLYKGLRGKVTFKWPTGKVPWFYYPRAENYKPFGTFADLVGLVSVISQCIVTAINYDFARRAANSPIKLSLLPIIFVLGILFSRILAA